MTAPALVMLATGSIDPHVAQVSHALCSGISDVRPTLDVHTAFLGQGAPTGMDVVSKLVASGVDEIVFVPLHLTHAVTWEPEVDELLTQVRTKFPRLRLSASRPLGPASSLLAVLDDRLRSALATSHVLELDGLVLSSEGSGDVRGNALLARRVRQWSAHHKLPCVTALADGTGPNTAQAIAALRSQGRRHIAIGSMFLAADERYNDQAALALRHGAVAVSAPIGADTQIEELVLARYAFAAMELLDVGFAVEDESQTA